MSEVTEPRYHRKWRTNRADREEDAACLFGYYLIKNCRERSIAEIPHAVGSGEHSAAVAAIEHALFGVMELLGGYRPLDAGDGKRLELLLHAPITRG
jgi:hypothetical protein